MASNDDIVRIASLMVALDRDDADNSFAGQLDRELQKLDRTDTLLTVFVSKMIAGKPYRIVSDNPATLNRALVLADHVGATVEFLEQDSGQIEIVFAPPTRQ
jgi:hypothetical protein